MQVLAVVDYERAGRKFHAALTPAGWQVKGDQQMPAILDLVMDTAPGSGADPSPLWTAARHVAAFLGGEVRWVRKLKDRGPGWIN